MYTTAPSAHLYLLVLALPPQRVGRIIITVLARRPPLLHRLLQQHPCRLAHRRLCNLHIMPTRVGHNTTLGSASAAAIWRECERQMHMATGRSQRHQLCGSPFLAGHPCLLVVLRR